MPAVLEADDLCISFGAVIAADRVTVSVAEREVLGIIGANGAGKTTFVNMVTGHLKPTRGTIRFLGRDITHLPSRAITQLGICRSFQIPQVFAELSVLDNLLMAIGIAKGKGWQAWRPIRHGEAVQQAEELLARYDLADYAERKAGLLPQGVRKLLDIAMATVRAPRIVLLDEPTSGISFDEKFAVMDILMAALAAVETTVLFVEHDMEIVERYAGRVVAFYDGKVIADGEPQSVLADPDVRQYVVGSQLHRRAAAGGT
ncbi:MAG: ABC transporter ATP-binding protein [Kiloniellales bacterium]